MTDIIINHKTGCFKYNVLIDLANILCIKGTEDTVTLGELSDVLEISTAKYNACPSPINLILKSNIDTVNNIEIRNLFDRDKNINFYIFCKEMLMKDNRELIIDSELAEIFARIGTDAMVGPSKQRTFLDPFGTHRRIRLERLHHIDVKKRKKEYTQKIKIIKNSLVKEADYNHVTFTNLVEECQNSKFADTVFQKVLIYKDLVKLDYTTLKEKYSEERLGKLLHEFKLVSKLNQLDARNENDIRNNILTTLNKISNQKSIDKILKAFKESKLTKSKFEYDKKVFKELISKCDRMDILNNYIINNKHKKTEVVRCLVLIYKLIEINNKNLF